MKAPARVRRLVDRRLVAPALAAMLLVALMLGAGGCTVRESRPPTSRAGAGGSPRPADSVSMTIPSETAPPAGDRETSGTAPAPPATSRPVPAPPPAPAPRPASPFVDPAFQTGILREVNFARTRPADYADLVEQWERYFDGDVLRRPGHLPVVTREGAAAVRGAVRFLREVHPVSPVRLSEGMSWAAVDHVLDQGPRAAVGHEGSDGSQSWDRMERYGEWSGSAGEDIWYGRGNPRDVVIALIVDDGVPARGHRQNLFDPDFRVIGVGCGTHAYYDSMCVLTFAGGYQERAR